MDIKESRAPADWLAILKLNGYRLTGPRYCVAEIFTKTDKALTALDTYNVAYKSYPSLGLVSVYRKLDKLELLGLIQKVHKPEGCHAYVAAPRGHEHLLVCRSCGKVDFFSGDNLMPLVDVVEQNSGFRVQDHWLQLLGISQECQNHHPDGL